MTGGKTLRRRRLLVVANETVGSDAVLRFVDRRAHGATEVRVVAPALIGRLAFWASDESRARRAAGERLASCLEALRAAGVEAEGHVGDVDPLLAIEDALRVFPADEIVLATHPEGTSNWLARDVVSRARSRFRQPVHHIVAGEAAQRSKRFPSRVHGRPQRRPIRWAAR